MKENYHSCLVSRLSRFVTLTDHECEFIAEMEKEEQPRRKGRPIVSFGDPTDGIMVLKSGWAVVKADSSDGRSQTSAKLKSGVLN